MTPLTTLRKALTDPNLLGTVLAGDTWAAWRVLLIAAMGEALTDDERIIFKQLTQRDHEPLQRVDELDCGGWTPWWQEPRDGDARRLPRRAMRLSATCWCRVSAACCCASRPTSARPRSCSTMW